MKKLFLFIALLMSTIAFSQVTPIPGHLRVGGKVNLGIWTGAVPAAKWSMVYSKTSDTLFKIRNSVTGNDSSFFVMPNGYVGIGTTTPVTGLHSATSITTSPRGITSSQHNDGTEGAIINLRKSYGTNPLPTVITSGANLGEIRAQGYDGANYLDMGAIKFTSTGTIASTRVPTKMSFWTATDAAPSVLTERMTILPNGNVGFGTNNPGVSVDVVGLGRFSSGLTGTNVLYVQNAANGFSFLNNTGTVVHAKLDGVTGYLAIGTSTATNIISLGGNSSRKIWMERHTTAGTAGNTLTLEAGGATVGATDKDGGNQIVRSGIATGTGKSDVVIKTVTNGATGTTDRTATDKMQVLGRSLLDNTQAGTGYDALSYIDITPGTSGGMLQLMIGDGQEYVWAIFTSAAVVTLITNSANVVNTNTDAKFCIVDNGSTVRISNALGSTLTMSGTIIYNN